MPVLAKAVTHTPCPAVLALLTLTTTISFHQVDRRASILLVPYIGWTLYAAIMMNIAAGGHEEEVGLIQDSAVFAGVCTAIQLPYMRTQLVAACVGAAGC